MPSVLVELGFLTNKKEGRFLNSTNWQLKMANEVADAIYKYINNLKLNTITESSITRKVNQIIEFKVQIASGKNRITTKPYNFNGLKDVEIISFSGLYKYYYGANTNYSAMTVALNNAKSKGYKSAFIVAFKNGRKISVQEALKIQED